MSGIDFKNIHTVKGFFDGVNIIQDDGSKILATVFQKDYVHVINKHGFFNLNMVSDTEGVVINYVVDL